MIRITIFLFIGLVSCSENQTIKKNIYFSDVIIKQDTLLYTLSHCQATIINDSLIIELTGEDSSFNPYKFTLFQVKEKITDRFEQTYSITDTSYRLPLFKLYNKTIELNKSKYQRGDSLTGSIWSSIQVTHRWTDNFIDTMVIIGRFKTIVE
ncbi:MAG: hypothetical protein K2X48_17800 [Chitinophagaceae bacterium]|nr:hypothetical protein [Chitinophagaceae bacterium]